MRVYRAIEDGQPRYFRTQEEARKADRSSACRLEITDKASAISELNTAVEIALAESGRATTPVPPQAPACTYRPRNGSVGRRLAEIRERREKLRNQFAHRWDGQPPEEADYWLAIGEYRALGREAESLQSLTTREGTE